MYFVDYASILYHFQLFLLMKTRKKELFMEILDKFYQNFMINYVT